MRRWTILILAAACLAMAGCEFVAGLFRLGAAAADSPEAKASAAGVAQALGISPLWGWLSAAGGLLSTLFFGKKAHDNGKLVSALTGGLEDSKQDRTAEEAAVLQFVFKLIQASAQKMGVDAKLDAALAARGHNVKPVLRTLVTSDAPVDADLESADGDGR